MNNPYTAAFDVVADTENGYLVPDDLVREIVDAALAADTIGEGLDALLDSVHPGWMPGTARITDMYQLPSRGWRVIISKPGGTGTGFADEDLWHGTGATRMDAIRNAVAAVNSDRTAEN